MRATSLLAGWMVTAAVVAPATVMNVSAGELVVNADASDPVPRKAWDLTLDLFRKAYPSIDVKFNVYDHESYKKSIRNWLTSASPDVVFWYSGNRMRQFTKPGLFEDVSSLFTPKVKDELGPLAVDLVSDGGKQYAAPYSYYQWGIFYRKDILDKAGLTDFPKTWDGLLGACDKLNGAGVAPVAIGTKDLWPTAGWFDYIDLRLNGYDFHMKLMEGRFPYTDPKVKDVFAHWKQLLDHRCFVKDHASSSWQESQSLLYQGKAAMMLIGNFITPNFPPEVSKEMAFAPFPVIDPAMGGAEDAPMETIAIPTKAKNKDDAKTFLGFVLRADVQDAMNKVFLQIPVNRESGVADDTFLRQGKDLLSHTQHLAQFFDRDTSEDLATGGMKGFQEFMIKPERVDHVLDDLERARKRIYGATE